MTKCKGSLTVLDYGYTEFTLIVDLGKTRWIKIESTAFSSETVARNQAEKFAKKHNLQIEWE